MFAKLDNVCQRFLRGLVVPENNKDLANAVRDWINDSGLTQARISANGGPSSTTITKILTGKGSFRQALRATPRTHESAPTRSGWGRSCSEQKKAGAPGLGGRPGRQPSSSGSVAAWRGW